MSVMEMSALSPSRRETPWGRGVNSVHLARQILGLPLDAAEAIARVAPTYPFRANDYYLGLIDWSDPDDPIRRIIIPRLEELHDWGKLDASDEASNTVVPGVQHKYRDTALILVNSACAALCRHCFRKRLFMDDSDETAQDLTAAFAYVAAHPEITDVLFTGGDSLAMSTPRLHRILARFAAMPHIKTIRLGTKMPAFNPFRLTDDPALLAMLAEFATGDRSIHVMVHFDHPRELTPEAREAIGAVQQSGAWVVNQCPLLRGVNDDPATLAELFTTMTLLGTPQYYLFQGRPTAGNEPCEVPLVEGWRIFDAARRRVSGLSRRARFAMSHATGKVEIIGVDDRHIYTRYHRAKDPADESRVMIFHRDDQAHWLDQLRPVS